MKDMFSCDIKFNGKKIENKFLKFLFSVGCGVIVLIPMLIPLVLMAFGILYLVGV